jgi:hypothetical protein
MFPAGPAISTRVSEAAGMGRTWIGGMGLKE